MRQIQTTSLAFFFLLAVLLLATRHANAQQGIVVMCNGDHVNPGNITTAIHNVLSKSGTKF